MNPVYTKRLSIIPLSARQLRTLGDDMDALENELDLTYRGEYIDEGFMAAIDRQCRVIEGDPENWHWHTLWLIMRNEDRSVIGSFDFKAAPDSQGSVEIGYGLSPEFEHCGYMTETVQALCAWAKGHSCVKVITAQTDPDNLASQKVLMRCGFIRDDQHRKPDSPYLLWVLQA